MMISTCLNKDAVVFDVTHLLLCACAIIILLFSSCEKNLIVEINTNDKRLLVDGEFTNDSVIHSINLYCSGSLITGKAQTIVSGATIYVTDKTDTFYYKENIDTLGLYQTLGKCCGKGGCTYFLSISNIDFDKDGMMDSFTANSILPVPIAFDSLVSKRGLNGDNEMAVNNYAYYKIRYNGPDYIFDYTILNNHPNRPIENRLGSGEINRFESHYKMPSITNPDSIVRWESGLSIESDVVEGDTISYVCFNFTQKQFEFLKEFDNNTNGDPFLDNMFDQLKVPANVSTNIEPASKVAGYFFIYSISRISKVFKE